MILSECPETPGYQAHWVHARVSEIDAALSSLRVVVDAGSKTVSDITFASVFKKIFQFKKMVLAGNKGIFDSRNVKL